VTVPPSFLGVSTEYWTLPLLDRHPAALYRLLTLLRVPGDGPLIIRVGGDSADLSFWDPAGARLPRWAYGLSPQWLRQTGRLVRETGARLIIDLNLVNDTPRRAAAWASIAERELPRHSVLAFEVGNEPDIYSRQAWLATVMRSPLAVAPPPMALTPSRYIRDFRIYSRLLAHVAPHLPIAGPAIANPVSHGGWVDDLLDHDRGRVGLVTAHRYPYSACAQPGGRAYPTIVRVLSQRASDGTAAAVAGLAAAAHRDGKEFRLTELNSVTCGGVRGISDSFATALWAPDTLFALARAHVDGVNIHVRAYPVNGAVGLTRGGYEVRPLLYGMLLFDRAIAPGARLVPAAVHARPRLHLVAWALRLRDGGAHIVLLDKGPRPLSVTLRGVTGARTAWVELLRAPSVRARHGVTFAGQWLTPQMTWRGRFHATAVHRSARGYVVTVPGGSAALVLIARSRAASRPALPTTRASSGSPMRLAALSAAARVRGVGRWASHSTRV
jgi:hypothetical protein